jgi:hypothetical protein
VLQVIPDVGHLSPREAPPEIARHLDTFAKDLQSREASQSRVAAFSSVLPAVSRTSAGPPSGGHWTRNRRLAVWKPPPSCARHNRCKCIEPLRYQVVSE